MLLINRINNQINAYFKEYNELDSNHLFEEIYRFIVFKWFLIKQQLDSFILLQKDLILTSKQYHLIEKEKEEWLFLKDQLCGLSQWIEKQRQKKIKVSD